jgi:hypothetical protein
MKRFVQFVLTSWLALATGVLLSIALAVLTQ